MEQKRGEGGIFKKGGKLGQGVGCLKNMGEAGTPLWTMRQYFNAPFLHSVSSFENIWLITTFNFCQTFRWMTLLCTYSTTLQVTNWTNIGFGPHTHFLFCEISLSVSQCALLIYISISSYVYGRLIFVVKSSANIFKVFSQVLFGFWLMFLKIKLDLM